MHIGGRRSLGPANIDAENDQLYEVGLGHECCVGKVHNMELVYNDVDLPQDNVRKDMEYDVDDQNPGDHPLYFCLFQFNGKEHRHDCCN